MYDNQLLLGASNKFLKVPKLSVIVQQFKAEPLSGSLQV